MSFTVAFAGARDNYQVPLALHEGSMLSALVTDLYSPFAEPALPFQFFKKFASRQHPALPACKVHSTIAAVDRAFFRPLCFRVLGLARNPRTEGGEVQDILSRAALRVAEQNQSHLFLYAGYAHKAFVSPRSRPMKKVLFMYHPHIKLSSEILLRDCEQTPALKASLASIQEDLSDETNEEELRLADLVVCASTFTSRSIQYIGIPKEKIRVIPYGIDTQRAKTHPPPPQSTSKTCEFLFIGSGIHRKGLHLLLQAWKKAAPTKGRLTVVARSIEEDISKLLNVPNLRFIPGTTRSNIIELYRHSDVFVMPSLVEGFGYVYLEALSHGCFCIGTHNTGLPDLHLQNFAAKALEAGNVNDLADAILDAAARHASRQIDREAIARCLEAHSWKQFRREIAGVSREVLGGHCNLNQCLHLYSK